MTVDVASLFFGIRKRSECRGVALRGALFGTRVSAHESVRTTIDLGMWQHQEPGSQKDFFPVLGSSFLNPRMEIDRQLAGQHVIG
jgi:hypothetical protein